jgi:hypothetical protein
MIHLMVVLIKRKMIWNWKKCKDYFYIFFFVFYFFYFLFLKFFLVFFCLKKKILNFFIYNQKELIIFLLFINFHTI